jgi:RNA polymerase sigma factor for flagellar operon FliA
MHRAFSLYSKSSPQNDEAALITKYASLIDRIARRMAARVRVPSAFDDLWSAGALGLIDASKRFDESQNVRFESFAEHRIRGAMLDELRKMDHLPRRLRAQTDKVQKAKVRLGHELGHEPAADELAAAVGIDLAELGEIEMLSMPHMPLANNLPTPSDEELLDEKISKQQLLKNLTTAIATLSERLQILMSLHYVEGLTYREIAQVLTVSEPRVCQLHSEAIKKIRIKLEEMETAPRDREEDAEEKKEKAPPPRGPSP